VRFLGSDAVADITPLLPAFDALVTDYSSIAFDAALVPVPTIWFAPDLDAYVARRGMYGTYSDAAGDDWAADWAGAIEQLDAVLGDEEVRRERVARAIALSARLHSYADGGNAARVHEAIHTRLRTSQGGAR
jgi:CDP-glycerol glycerophosphotransferase